MVGVGGGGGVVVGSTLLWIVITLYLAGSLYWLYEVLVYGVHYERPDPEYGPEDVQVRFLTINNEAVVRQSVAQLPPELDDVWVVAEEPMDVPGANVAVVPDEFECEATNKGRALEWARRHVPCDREFVLFLDEDSHLREFTGLPDADIVQFTERPRRTSSLLCFLAELNRIGFQIEQTAFSHIEVPLYAWGGGIAIRESLEQDVGWNYPTVIEDTVFLWRAHVQERASYEFVSDRVSNQAPPSLSAMFRQRRRWIAGAREDNDLLSIDRVLMYGIRDLSWSVTGLIPVITVVALAPGISIVFPDLYQMLSLGLLGLLFVWISIGLKSHPQSPRTTVATVLLAPFTTILHSVGALWGLVSQPNTFEVTEKVSEPGGSGGAVPAADGGTATDDGREADATERTRSEPTDAAERTAPESIDDGAFEFVDLDD
jgi:hypothetical protein